MPVAGRSNALVCGCLPAGITVSNPAENVMPASSECCVFFRYKSLLTADHSSRGVLHILLSLCVILKPQQ